MQTDYGWHSPVTAAEKAEALNNKLKRGIGDKLNLLSLAVLVLLQILLPFVSAGVRNPFGAEYLFSTLCSVFSTLLAYYLFMPCGKRDRLKLPDAENVLTVWEKLSERIRNEKKLTEFRQFCKRKAAEEQNERRAALMELLENGGIGEAEYREKWRLLSCKELQKARRKGILSGEQKKLILLVKRLGDPSPIDPNFVLVGNPGVKENDALRNDSPFEKRAILRKPVLCILSVLLQSFFYPAAKGNADVVATLCAVVLRIFCICFAALSGYRTGVQAGLCRTEDARRRSAFLAEFLEEP